MDNENSIDENYSELNKCLACGKQYRAIRELAWGTKGGAPLQMTTSISETAMQIII